jgi:hypothetical protein
MFVETLVEFNEQRLAFKSCKKLFKSLFKFRKFEMLNLIYTYNHPTTLHQT